MKKAIKVFLILVSVFMLVGCGDSISINNQESDLIAEYIAGVVLKYNGDGLQRQQQIVIEQNKEDETESATNSSGESGSKETQESIGGNSGQSGTIGSTGITGEVMKDLATGLGLSGIEITYKGYEKGDRYPEDGLFSVPANTNCVVFGFEFELKNNTGADVVVNTDAKPIIFKLGIDGQIRVQSSSILANDMTSLKNVTVKAGEAYETAVVFQIPKGSADSTNGMDLQVYSNGKLLGSVPGLQ